MTFGAPQWFWGLLAIPLLVALFFRAERRSAQRLRQFVSQRLLPQLAGTVDRFRRALRFSLQLLGLACAIVALAQPQFGYTFQDVKRKGLDLLIAIDTSRSMLSNDVQPDRLEQVKLAAQDLINELQGDRVGLIAFAGLAFLQAPLTIDYGAVVESINELDTKIVPEGGTNISEAITLATRTFGKSAAGNRALIIFTDGEELSGDAVRSAKAAAAAGVRIFTVGVGTPEGSLIPVTDEDGATAFVKDPAGQVVKSKLDEKRLRDIAQATGGFYLRLENGPRAMQQIYRDGLGKMQAAEFDVRLSRRPIERYQWPLGVALVALALSIWIGERKRRREAIHVPAPAKVTTAMAALLLLSFQYTFATAPGLELYRDGKYDEAYQRFQEDLKNHPDSPAKDKMQFDAGTAAYKMRDYSKAIESFSQALLSKETGMQENSHFNMGRTLEERADMAKTDDDALRDLENAKTHYEDALKLNPNNENARANLEAVKKKIERLKKPKPTPTPTPTPPLQQPPKKGKNEGGGGNQSQQNQQQQNQQNQKNQQNQQQNSQQNQQQQEQKNQQQSQDRQSQNNKNQEHNKQSEAKNEQKSSEQPKPGETPLRSPSSGEQKRNEEQPSATPEPSSSPGKGGNETPSPSPGSGEENGENAESSPTPSETPQKKFAGEVKGAKGNRSEKPPDKTAESAEAEPEKEGQMSERQAQALLQSVKDEEARVRLDEHRVTHRVYKDW